MTEEPRENVERESQLAFQQAVEWYIREGLTMPSFGRVTTGGQQLLPINMYETGEDLVLVTPLPGARTEDIEVTVTEQIITIRGGSRGPGRENKDYRLHEWNYGPYYRTVNLPVAVDAYKANASFSNGVLVVSLPKSEVTRTRRITLRRMGQNRGECAGHSSAEFMPGGHRHHRGPCTD